MPEKEKGINVAQWTKSNSRFFNGDPDKAKSFIEEALKINPNVKPGELFRLLSSDNGRGLHNIIPDDSLDSGITISLRKLRRKR